MLGVERGKGVITEATGARHIARRSEGDGYNGNRGHIIYEGLTWKEAGQMSEDEEGPKEMGHVTRSSGEQMAGEKMVQKATRQEGGPTSIPHHSGPPPPLLKAEWQRGFEIA
jgi:hypothetical protein